MKEIQPVWHACTLKPNALDIRVSSQIADLQDAICDLQKGKRFFDNTHLTGGLKELMREGLSRLSGRSQQAVFLLKQAMGGGKTHLLVAMGLLARHPELRKIICPDLQSQFPFGQASVATFNGRNHALFWEKLAQQLDKSSVFKKSTLYTPPDEELWLEFFSDNKPHLILLDELPPYFHHHNAIASGKGTQADLLVSSLASLLTAASKKSNVCIILSDLDAAYAEGSKGIGQALRNLQQEVGRQAKTIIPVDLTGQEIYEILKKNLFDGFPDEEKIKELAEHYAEALSEAGRSKFVDRNAQMIAEEISSTYPFHPKLKNLIALFKENEKFRQTRGLLDLVSRLLHSIWERKDKQAFLIGAEQFDFSLVEVRNAFEGIRSMPDVVANDIWAEHGRAVAQSISFKKDPYAGQKVAGLLMASSLSTSINAIKGLSETDLLECLTFPGSEPEEYKTALQHLSRNGWYLHSNSEGKHYFDTQENLAKKLQRWAENAPQPKVDQLKREQLKQLFSPKEKDVYEEVLALPGIDEVQECTGRHRALIIYDPDGKIPPERIQELFSTSTKKNNFCILTGSQTVLAETERAARELYAIQVGENTLGKEKESEEFKERKKRVQKDFFSTLLALFNRVLIPAKHKENKKAYLREVHLQWTSRSHEGFVGEEEIASALSETGIKKYMPEPEEELLLQRIERDLFEGEDRVRWQDLLERSQSNSSFPWLRKKALENTRKMAMQKGLWVDEENGWINKKPAPPRPEARITLITEPDEDGTSELQVHAVNAGSSPKIYYSEDPKVPSNDRTELEGDRLRTQRLRLYFLATDPTGNSGVGTPEEWTGKIVITATLPKDQGSKRLIELQAKPYGCIKYTLDGSDPKIHGRKADGPFDLGPKSVNVLAYAAADGIETQWQKSYPDISGGTEPIDLDQPAILNLSKRRSERFDGATAWKLLAEAKQIGAHLIDPIVDIKDGKKALQFRSMDLEINAVHLEEAIQTHARHFGDQPKLVLGMKKIRFLTGRDLEALTEQMQISYTRDEVEQ